MRAARAAVRRRAIPLAVVAIVATVGLANGCSGVQRRAVQRSSTTGVAPTTTVPHYPGVERRLSAKPDPILKPAASSSKYTPATSCASTKAISHCVRAKGTNGRFTVTVQQTSFGDVVVVTKATKHPAVVAVSDPMVVDFSYSVPNAVQDLSVAPVVSGGEHGVLVVVQRAAAGQGPTDVDVVTWDRHQRTAGTVATMPQQIQAIVSTAQEGFLVTMAHVDPNEPACCYSREDQAQVHRVGPDDWRSWTVTKARPAAPTTLSPTTAPTTTVPPAPTCPSADAILQAVRARPDLLGAYQSEPELSMGNVRCAGQYAIGTLTGPPDFQSADVLVQSGPAGLQVITLGGDRLCSDTGVPPQDWATLQCN